MNDDKQPLPVALRDTEITEADVETLLRIAQDKDATSGRYKRILRRIIEESLFVPPDIINDATNNPTNYAAVKIADKKGVM